MSKISDAEHFNLSSILEEKETSMIYQSNELIDAQFTMSVHEMNLLMTLYWIVIKTGEIDKEYVLDVTQLASVLGVSATSLYHELRKGINDRGDKKGIMARLRDRKFEIVVTDENNNVGTKSISWITSQTFFPEPGKVSFGLNPELLPFIQQIEQLITYFNPFSLIKLKTTYAKRLYLLIKSHIEKENNDICHNKNISTLYVEHIIDALGLPEGMSRIDNLKRHIIDKSIKDINSQTSMKIEKKYHPIKEGRKIIGFSFCWEINKEEQLQICPDSKDELLETMTETDVYRDENKQKSKDFIESCKADSRKYQTEKGLRQVKVSASKALINEFGVDICETVLKWAVTRKQNYKKGIDTRPIDKLGGIATLMIRNFDDYKEEIIEYLKESSSINQMDGGYSKKDLTKIISEKKRITSNNFSNAITDKKEKIRKSLENGSYPMSLSEIEIEILNDKNNPLREQLLFFTQGQPINTKIFKEMKNTIQKTFIEYCLQQEEKTRKKEM